MFLLNFKKEWKMHKSLLITFFIIAIAALAFITVLFAILNFLELSTRMEDILNIVLLFFVGIVSMVGGILPIVIMYIVLKSDLGKNNVQHTIFTPQSVFVWYLPKLLFVFIIQSLFSTINVIYNYYVMVLTDGTVFEWSDNLLLFFFGTFGMGTFGLLTLCMAAYYSFRKKGLSWFMVFLTVFVYVAAQITYGIIMAVNMINGVESNITENGLMWIQYGLDSGIGVIFIIFALYLFDKKIEY